MIEQISDYIHTPQLESQRAVEPPFTTWPSGSDRDLALERRCFLWNVRALRKNGFDVSLFGISSCLVVYFPLIPNLTTVFAFCLLPFISRPSDLFLCFLTSPRHISSSLRVSMQRTNANHRPIPSSAQDVFAAGSTTCTARATG